MKKSMFLFSTSIVLAGCASHPRLGGRTAWSQQSATPPIYSANSAAPAAPAEGGPALNERGTGSSGIATSQETADHLEIPLHREELVVGKRDVSNGGVVVRTVVHSEQVTKPVELRREEFVVERVPANQAPQPGAAQSDGAFQEHQYFIPLMREEPVVGKRAIITERVQIGKQVETERQNVRGQVRSEDVEIVNNANRSAGAPVAAPEPAPSNAGPQAAAVAQPNTTDRNELQLAREELVVGKRAVENGGAVVRKIVRTQQVNQPVELRREEVNIQRTPENQPVSTADFQPREIRVDLKREEPVINTRNMVTEVVRVEKQTHVDRQDIAGTVRQESIDIVQNPAVNAQDRAVGGTGQPIQSGSGSATEQTITQPQPAVAPVRPPAAPLDAPAPAPTAPLDPAPAPAAEPRSAE